MQRYFGKVNGENVFLNEDDIFHFTRVMRAKINDEIEVVSDNKIYLCKATCFTPLKIEVVEEIKENNELTNNVILIAALIKGEKMDFVLQKATELGAKEIVLLETSRTIVKISKNDENKLNRYRKILKEAAEQSKRSQIPTLNRVITLQELKDIDSDIKLIAYEKDSNSSTSFIDIVNNAKPNQTISIVIGPEGGFSEDEVELAIKQGYVRVGLGKRILRAETASLYALSVIGALLEGK